MELGPLQGKNLLEALTAFSVAALCLLGMNYFSEQEVTREQTQNALRWARQISTQIESMSLRGQELGEKDPFRFAIQLLSQGVEPRTVQITEIQGEDTEDPPFKLDSEAGVFEYSKIFDPKNQSGAKIRIQIPFEGFLGTHSLLASDAMSFLIFSVIYGLTWLAMRLQRISQAISNWVQTSIVVINEMGVKIRKTIRAAHTLALASRRSHTHLEVLREKILTGINQIHSQQGDAKKLLILLKEGESLASAALSRGQEYFSVSDFLDYLKLVKSLAKAAQKTGADLEKNLEPWSLEIDLAYQAHTEASTAQHELNSHIREQFETFQEVSNRASELQ